MGGSDSPFHSGEHMLQLRAGIRRSIEALAAEEITRKLDADTVTRLPPRRTVIVALLDDSGYPTCTAVSGQRGLLASTECGDLAIRRRDLPETISRLATPLDAPVSLLVPMFAEREALRINGWIAHATDEQFVVEIDQAFTNSRKYLHIRGEHRNGTDTEPSSVEPNLRPRGSLSRQMSELLRNADTLFVSTRHSETGKSPRQSLDVSHRAGLPGFMVTPDANTVLWPEYGGNGFFNTMGNLMLDSRCGLVVMAGNGPQALHLRGKAEVLWHDDLLEEATGTRRGIRFTVEQASFVDDVLNRHHPLIHYAPELAPRAPGRSQRRSRLLRVEEKITEAPDVVSLNLVSTDGLPLFPFSGGQHIAIAERVSGEQRPLERDYTLSSYQERPESYRVTVKREPGDTDGEHSSLSSRLHGEVDTGDVVETRPPSGEFTLPAPLTRPLVFVSAGIGVTPIVAMLQELAERAPDHPVWIIHGARNRTAWALRDEMRALTDRLVNAHWHIRFSQPSNGDVPTVDYDEQGRVDLDTLKGVLPFDGYDFFLCGPDDFLTELYAGICELGVDPALIHVESFGIQGDQSHTTPTDTVLPVPRSVHFTKSDVHVTWTPDRGTLLDFAEKAGIDAPYSCRTGMCGTCSHQLVAGNVRYVRNITARPAAGHILLCSAIPASDVEIEL